MSFFKEQIMGLEPENKPKINSEQISDNIATKNIHMMSKSMAEIRAVKRVNKPEKIVEEKTPMEKKLYKWQKITIWIMGVLTFIAVTANGLEKEFNVGYFLDLIFGISINIFVLWLLFKAGNWVYLKSKR